MVEGNRVELDNIWEIYDLLIEFTEYEDALLKCLKNNNLEGAFDIMSSRDRIAAYKLIFNHIPDANKYDLFINAYCSAEYCLTPLLAKSLIRFSS